MATSFGRRASRARGGWGGVLVMHGRMQSYEVGRGDEWEVIGFVRSPQHAMGHILSAHDSPHTV